MRAFIITAILLLLGKEVVFAQYPLNFPPDMNWEAGLNGGFSTCTRPVGPPDSYRGTRTNSVGDYSLRLGYYITPHWQLNFDLGSRPWTSYGTWQINGMNGLKLNPQDITFSLAQRAVSETVQFNFVIPFYTRFEVYNRANLYFGTMLGLVTTMNDGSETVNHYHGAPDSVSYTYVSKLDYAAGIGWSTGVQMGFTYYLVPKLALNIEIAARYANVTTSENNNAEELRKYRLMYFPETFGIRYRF